MNQRAQQLAARTRRRGAAMVESVVVISTMLVFLGLIVWTRQAYGAKLDLQQRTRSDTLYYASHGCEGSTGGSASSGTGGTVGGDRPPGSNASSGQPGAAALDKSWNEAKGTLQQTVELTAVVDNNATGQNASISYGRMALKSNVKASSEVTCNEKKYTNQLTAWFQFGMDMVSSGGGFGNLFN